MKKRLVCLFFLVSILLLFNSIEAKVINCGNDYDCFLNASVNCEKSKVVVNDSIDLFFVRFDLDTQMQIKGMKKDSCILSVKNKKVDFVLNETILNEFSFGLMTHKEFVELQRRARSQAKQYKDFSGSCKLSNEELTGLLNTWNLGFFDPIIDYKELGCRGRFFSDEI